MIVPAEAPEFYWLAIDSSYVVYHADSLANKLPFHRKRSPRNPTTKKTTDNKQQDEVVFETIGGAVALPVPATARYFLKSFPVSNFAKVGLIFFAQGGVPPPERLK